MSVQHVRIQTIRQASSRHEEPQSAICDHSAHSDLCFTHLLRGLLEPGRRNTRSRHVTTRLAVVDESVRNQVTLVELDGPSLQSLLCPTSYGTAIFRIYSFCSTPTHRDLQVAQARLEALENDNEAPDTLAADSGDEEFVLDSDDSGAHIICCFDMAPLMQSAFQMRHDTTRSMYAVPCPPSCKFIQAALCMRMVATCVHPYSCRAASAAMRTFACASCIISVDSLCAADAKPGKKGKKKGKGAAGKRKLKTNAPERRGPKTFQRVLEEVSHDLTDSAYQSSLLYSCMAIALVQRSYRGDRRCVRV